MGNQTNIPAPTILFDTTLRDGEQAPGVTLTPTEKAEYVRRAEDAGIRYIEIGFPQNTLDLEACKAAAKAARGSRLVAMSLTTMDGVERVCEVGAHEILFVVPCSSNHLSNVYGQEVEVLLERLVECAEFATERGLAVNVGLEDASERDTEIVHRVLARLSSLENNVDCVTVPDTRGQLLPSEVVELLADLRPRLPGSRCRLAFHAHNDLGLATANSLAALQMDPSVDCIQATTCGFGERAGNASLEQIAVLLEAKLGRPSLVDLQKLQSLAEYVEGIFLTPISAHAPVIGSKVFLHESGLHQKGMLNDKRAYQYLDPEQFGREAGLLLGKHSGKHLRQWIAQRAECGEGEVLELQQAVTSIDKEKTRATLRRALDEVQRHSLVGIERDEAVRLLRAQREVGKTSLTRSLT